MRQQNNISRKKKNAEDLDAAKKSIAAYCGIGGDYSALELIVIFAAKEGLTVRGDIHPHQQIKKFVRIIKSKEAAPKLKVRTLKDFYSSRAWKILRYQAFEKHGNKCQCCGTSPSLGAVLHVDHIKPKSTHSHLALDLNNLQILCSDCNIGKINQFDTDWRNEIEHDEALADCLVNVRMP